jgi:hypothetical protein
MLLEYEQLMKRDAKEAYELRLELWAILNAGAQKPSKQPSPPPILR